MLSVNAALSAIALSFLLLFSVITSASEQEYYPDHEEAIRLRQAGTILPLQQILQQIPPRFGDNLLEVELERKQGRYLYEIEILTPHGEVYELYFDASNGQLLQQQRED
ncbi:peptidase [Ectothiorhodospiraceae bacterium BW-2]|nr:peptidase [Ectothiorhodospiraceae bacterium BW-2]